MQSPRWHHTCLMDGWMSEYRVGISGWTYAPWRGVFYPRKLPHSRELAHASRQFNTIEINGSFYSLQRASSYQAWYEAAPVGFVFSVKGGRYITHMRRLKDVEGPLANFFASGILALREKLGPILWQFPPNMKWDPERFGRFLNQLPYDTDQASRLAERHDDWLEGRTFLEGGPRRPLRHAIEVRNETFRNPAFFRLLRDHGVALVFSDSSGYWPYFEDITSPGLVYARLHGEGKLYSGGYGDEALDLWARKSRRWKAGGRDVFVYFDNDAKVKAPGDARELMARLRIKWNPGEDALAKEAA